MCYLIHMKGSYCISAEDLKFTLYFSENVNFQEACSFRSDIQDEEKQKSESPGHISSISPGRQR